MNQDTITQILETIKTFNFNVDSQTLEGVVAQLKPIIYLYIIGDIVANLCIVSVFLCLLYLGYRLAKRAIEFEEKKYHS